jgi:hypothetical protein
VQGGGAPWAKQRVVATDAQCPPEDVSSWGVLLTLKLHFNQVIVAII